MEKLLTISIAAYQVEKYIRQTLDSLIVPEILDKLEVLVIDDGGKDGTLAIAKEYEAKYPGVFYAVHKENGGYGSTVNYSIEHATGKYIRLLDGDDWFNTPDLVRYINFLEHTDSDVVITPYYKFRDGDTIPCGKQEVENKFDGKTLLISEMPCDRVFGIWAITHKLDVVRRSGLKHPEHMLYTDAYFSLIPFSAAKTICFADTFVYCYRVGRDGQSISREARIKHAAEAFDFTEAMCCFAEKQKNSPNYPYIRRRAMIYYIKAIKTWMLLPICKESLDGMRAYEKKISKLAPDIYAYAEEFGKIGKFLWLLRNMGYLPYWALKLIPGGTKNWD